MGLLIILLLVCIVFYIVYKRCWRWELIEVISGTISLISGLIFAGMIILIIIIYITAIGDRVKLHQQYDSLVYKIENEKYRDEFGLVNKEVIDEVQDWNMDCVFNKALNHDFWVGIFIPDFFDEFEIIDLNDIHY